VEMANEVEMEGGAVPERVATPTPTPARWGTPMPVPVTPTKGSKESAAPTCCRLLAAVARERASAPLMICLPGVAKMLSSRELSLCCSGCRAGRNTACLLLPRAGHGAPELGSSRFLLHLHPAHHASLKLAELAPGILLHLLFPASHKFPQEGTFALAGRCSHQQGFVRYGRSARHRDVCEVRVSGESLGDFRR